MGEKEISENEWVYIDDSCLKDAKKYSYQSGRGGNFEAIARILNLTESQLYSEAIKVYMSIAISNQIKIIFVTLLLLQKNTKCFKTIFNGLEVINGCRYLISNIQLEERFW